MKFSDIAIKHLINFDFNTCECIAFLNPHHIFDIENCIHYKCLVDNNFNDYEMLLNTTNQPEHSLLSYKTLIRQFDLKKMEPIIFTFNSIVKKYLVEDGCHRLSILKHKKIFNKTIPDQYIIIK